MVTRLLTLLVLVVSGLAQYDPNCGGKQVMVHLFEWKWTDIARECENYLGPNNFCGVQVSPPTEHIKLPTYNPPHPWWIRYQPASYILESRSGSEIEFTDMVQRCNQVGVRVYVDAVINHMTGKESLGVGDAGSPYSGHNLDFPGVPYRAEHFTPSTLCPSPTGDVDDYYDPENVRNCYLLGLADLYGELPYVQNMIVGYLNKLIDIGVAGIRIDAAKHMWPQDIQAILSKLNTLPTSQGFVDGSRLYVYQEVIDQNDGAVTVDQYYDTGYVTEFRYCSRVAAAVKDYNLFTTLIDNSIGMAQSDRAFVFVDNHDNQRGHGSTGDILTFKERRDYIQAQAFTLAYNYGFTRIMSSYDFTNTDQGPPTSDGYRAADVIINADGSCGGGWICEHRWNVQRKMAQFRNVVAGTTISNFWNDGTAVAFSRGGLGFFAMAQSGSLSKNLQTGLPPGSYCNIIDECSTYITVTLGGFANVVINNYDEPIFAACLGCDAGFTTRPPTSPTSTLPASTTTITPTTAPPLGPQRTVVFINQVTNPGQDMFIRGGIDAAIRPPCTDITSSCALPFTINSLGTSTHYDKYDAWREGDTKLDWFGSEVNQGSYLGATAQGSPLVWTSNVPTDPGFQDLNKWGDHYWMIDFEMDCSLTQSGWFEVKAFVSLGVGWELDIAQTPCTGIAGGVPPYTSKNHMGKCGHINLFFFNQNACNITNFPA